MNYFALVSLSFGVLKFGNFDYDVCICYPVLRNRAVRRPNSHRFTPRPTCSTRDANCFAFFCVSGTAKGKKKASVATSTAVPVAKKGKAKARAPTKKKRVSDNQIKQQKDTINNIKVWDMRWDRVGFAVQQCIVAWFLP